jgi:hypothetical protein
MHLHNEKKLHMIATVKTAEFYRAAYRTLYAPFRILANDLITVIISA